MMLSMYGTYMICYEKQIELVGKEKKKKNH
jgi:hypothetical protein